MMEESNTTIILGAPGCISGDAEICLNRFGKAFKTSLEELYLYGLAPKKPTNGLRKITTRSLTCEGIFRLNEILHIYYSGQRKTTTVETATKKLSLTSDHEILSPNGWVRVENLKLGDQIYTESFIKQEPVRPKFCYDCGKPIKLRLSTKHTYFGLCYACIVSILRVTKPDAAIEKNGYILRKDPSHPRNHRSYVLEHILVLEQKLGRRLIKGEVTHHVDENPANNSPENLEVITNKAHYKRHNVFKNRSLEVFLPALEKVISLCDGGIRKTFDLEMKEPDHNFIANGIVVHNCAKTTTLLNIVEEALAAGVKPNRIGFISFTKVAVEEGKTRASKRFSMDPDDLPHFRTIHSFCFKHLGQKREQMLGYQHMRELGKLLGIDFKGRGEVLDADVYGMNDADRLVFLEGLARNTLRPLKDVWTGAMEDAVDWFELERFSKALAAFKKSRMLSDFNDLISRFTTSDPRTLPELDLLLVDEFQDVSPLQMTAIRFLATKAKQVYVCGDDCQTLFGWAGASVKQFIELPGKQITLEQSYRVPLSVHKLADSLSDRISKKRPRFWKPREEQGQVNWFNSIEEIPMDDGSWLCMTRHGYQLTAMEDYCLSQGYSFNSVGRDPLKSPTLKAIQVWENLRKGVEESAEHVLDVFKYMANVPGNLVKKLKTDESSRMYAMPELVQLGLTTTDLWHRSLTKISASERDYFIAVRKRGEKLLRGGRIRCSTIHSAKGAEADNVVLTTDLSLRTYNNMESNFDDECRVFYVGVTRAKKTLNLIIPQTDLHFEL